MRNTSYINLNALTDEKILSLICEFIRKSRIDQQYSQQELSERAGISRSTLSLIERGTSPTLETLIKILRALDRLETLSELRYEKVVSPLKVAEEDIQERYRVRKKKGTDDPLKSDW